MVCQVSDVSVVCQMSVPLNFSLLAKCENGVDVLCLLYNVDMNISLSVKTELTFCAFCIMLT